MSEELFSLKSEMSGLRDQMVKQTEHIEKQNDHMEEMFQMMRQYRSAHPTHPNDNGHLLFHHDDRRTPTSTLSGSSSSYSIQLQNDDKFDQFIANLEKSFETIKLWVIPEVSTPTNIQQYTHLTSIRFVLWVIMSIIIIIIPVSDSNILFVDYYFVLFVDFVRKKFISATNEIREGQTLSNDSKLELVTSIIDLNTNNQSNEIRKEATTFYSAAMIYLRLGRLSPEKELETYFDTQDSKDLSTVKNLLTDRFVRILYGIPTLEEPCLEYFARLDLGTIFERKMNDDDVSSSFENDDVSSSLLSNKQLFRSCFIYLLYYIFDFVLLRCCFHLFLLINHH